jgi:hypothetical protein
MSVHHPITEGITILDWRPVERNTLRGFCTVCIEAWHRVIADVAVHEHESGRRWAQLPAKPQITSDRQPVIRDGKLAYTKVVWFADKAVADRFSDAVIEALDHAQPGWDRP